MTGFSLSDMSGLSLIGSRPSPRGYGGPDANLSMRTGVGLERRVDEDLRVQVGARERGECRVAPVEPDGAGDERLRVERAVRQHVQRVAELDRAVAEDEPQ